MRAWLRDRRAYVLLQKWLRQKVRKNDPRYSDIENFRAWVALTTNRFFDVTGTWKDEFVTACEKKLGECQ